jgi:hypothetical protein
MCWRCWRGCLGLTSDAGSSPGMVLYRSAIPGFQICWSSDLGVAWGVTATGKCRVLKVSLPVCLLPIHSLRPVLRWTFCLVASTVFSCKKLLLTLSPFSKDEMLMCWRCGGMPSCSSGLGPWDFPLFLLNGFHFSCKHSFHLIHKSYLHVRIIPGDGIIPLSYPRVSDLPI